MIKSWVSARRDVMTRCLDTEQEVSGVSHASSVVLEEMLFPRVSVLVGSCAKQVDVPDF